MYLIPDGNYPQTLEGSLLTETIHTMRVIICQRLILNTNAPKITLEYPVLAKQGERRSRA